MVNETQNLSNTYFKDRKTRIDFVLVVTKDLKTAGKNHLYYITQFVYVLQEHGIKSEIHKSPVKDNLYICMSLPSRTLEHFAQVYNVDIHNAGHKNIPLPHQFFNIFNTRLTKNNKNIFRRKGEASTMERILIMKEILNDMKYYEGEHSYSLESLVKLGVVKAFYPLHDGPSEHSDKQEDSEINDRQVLSKYWSDVGTWYRQQPLNLVEKYFGSELAFYFAWLGFYNQMLIPASIVGIICFIGGIIRLFAMEHPVVDEICNNEIYICQFCSTYETCIIKPLNISCTFGKVEYLFDNRITVFFATFMSLWATLFLTLWKRNENVLKIKWNVADAEYDTRVRRDYLQAVKTITNSTNVLDVEHLMIRRRILYKCITSALCVVLMIIIIVSVIGVIIYRIAMESLVAHYAQIVSDGVDIFAAFTASIIQIIFCKIFGKFYIPLSVMLTTMEIPRTQSDFDASVINKIFFLGFVNNYIPLFYIAFIQGRFYNPTYKLKSMYRLENDLGHATGSILLLSIQLSIYLLCKSLVGHIVNVVIILVKKRSNKQVNDISAPWEKEYDLRAFSEYVLTEEYMEMIIQYGFVTFFVAACPLAPLFALMNNILELRLDAEKFVNKYRRPIPRKHPGIGTWYGILKFATALGATTNAFVLAFTSDFVAKEIYRYSHGTLYGYLKSTLSEYDLENLNFNFANKYVHANTKYLILEHNLTICYYKGNRYPPHHKYAYDLTPEYFYELGMRLLYIIVFEHVVLLFRGILKHFIPETPTVVKEALNYELNLEREIKITKLTRTVSASKSRSLDKIFSPKRVKKE